MRDDRWEKLNTKIGPFSTEVRRMYEGEILEVHFWPRKLSGEEVRQLHERMVEGAAWDCDCVVCNPVDRDPFVEELEIDLGAGVKIVLPRLGDEE